MEQERFSIVFTKLTQAMKEETETKEGLSALAVLQAETAEIAELRRMVLETTEPEKKSYTTT